MGLFPISSLCLEDATTEGFLKDVKWLHDLKLRVGWGKTGQQNGIDDF